MWSTIFLIATGVLVAQGQDPCDTSNPPPEVTEAGSVIESPGFGEGSYPADSLCEWRVRAPQGNDITLSFTVFVVEDCIDCRCDYLELYDGENDSAPLIGRFCGSSENQVVESGPILYMRFASDGSVQGPGFSTVVDFIDVACTRGSDIVDGSGFILSPGYPDLYPAGSFCQWRFTSSDQDQRVHLKVHNFTLEDGCTSVFDIINDYVTFIDNNSGNELIALLFGSLGGNGFSYTSYTNEATVTFTSSAANSFTGFNISYSFDS